MRSSKSEPKWSFHRPKKSHGFRLSSRLDWNLTRDPPNHRIPRQRMASFPAIPAGSPSGRSVESTPPIERIHLRDRVILVVIFFTPTNSNCDNPQSKKADRSFPCKATRSRLLYKIGNSSGRRDAGLVMAVLSERRMGFF